MADNRKRSNKSRGGDSENKHTVVRINRVAKVTKGGRTFSFSTVVVVGDGKGSVGIGLGKSREVTGSIDKGRDDALKNMIKVPVHKGAIPHEQIGKYGAAIVLVRPAAKGTGVIAGGAMRAVLESAGVTDVIAKSLGSPNQQNVVKATLNALSLMRDAKTVARERGITIEKVFNG